MSRPLSPICELSKYVIRVIPYSRIRSDIKGRIRVMHKPAGQFNWTSFRNNNIGWSIFGNKIGRNDHVQVSNLASERKRKKNRVQMPPAKRSYQMPLAYGGNGGESPTPLGEENALHFLCSSVCVCAGLSLASINVIRNECLERKVCWR